MTHNWLDVLGWDKTEVDDLRYVAYSYIKQGVYDIALTFFEAIIVLTAPNIYDLQTLGALHLQLGNSLKALDFLDQVLKLDPHHTATKLNRAKALFTLGYKKQAIAAAEELEKSPEKEIAEAATALLMGYRS